MMWPTREAPSPPSVTNAHAWGEERLTRRSKTRRAAVGAKASDRAAGLGVWRVSRPSTLVSACGDWRATHSWSRWAPASAVRWTHWATGRLQARFDPGLAYLVDRRSDGVQGLRYGGIRPAARPVCTRASKPVTVRVPRRGVRPPPSPQRSPSWGDRH